MQLSDSCIRRLEALRTLQRELAACLMLRAVCLCAGAMNGVAAAVYCSSHVLVPPLLLMSSAHVLLLLLSATAAGTSALTEYKWPRWGQEEDPLPGIPSRVDSALARKLHLPFDVDLTALVASYKSSAAAAAGREEDEDGACTPRLSLFLANSVLLAVFVAHCLCPCSLPLCSLPLCLLTASAPTHCPCPHSLPVCLITV